MRELRNTIGRKEWLSRKALLYLLIIVIPFLSLSAGKKRVLIPLSDGEKVFYSYIHSYALFPVEDCWVFKGGKFYLFSESVLTGGEGNPSGDEGKYVLDRKGRMIFYDIWRELPDPVYIRVSGRYKNAISVKGKVYNLPGIFGDGVIRVSLIYMGW